MTFRSDKRAFAFLRTAAAAALLVSSLALPAPEAAAAGIFSGLGGSWRGDGSIGWSTGETERIRCTATYEVEKDGNQLIQNLTCATDSTRLIVKSDITYNPDAGAISGTWAETNYGIRGRVSGRASSGNIQALVTSSDARFKARVTVVTSGGNQTVTIAPQGIDVTEVSVRLRRAG
jgi:hypothetical protein